MKWISVLESYIIIKYSRRRENAALLTWNKYHLMTLDGCRSLNSSNLYFTPCPKRLSLLQKKREHNIYITRTQINVVFNVAWEIFQGM